MGGGGRVTRGDSRTIERADGRKEKLEKKVENRQPRWTVLVRSGRKSFAFF